MKEKELENINENLLPGGNKNPFVTPAGYFDELPSRVQERCVQARPVSSTEDTPIAQVIKSQLAFAAGFIGLALLAFFGYYHLQPTSEVESILSQDDYIEIVKRQIFDYDEATLLKGTEGYLDYDTLKNELMEDMIKYLLDENIDYVTLMELY